MTTFTIATWNVNSIRVRLPHLLTWLDQAKPDVLALQEIKLQTDDFPHEAFQELGYHATVSGQKTYNGVATLSRVPAGAEVLTDLPELADPQRRVLATTVGDVRILNLYVPNGESVESEKYIYKLNWLNKLHAFLQAELQVYAKLIVLGDFNIAPANLDVHDPVALDGRVLCSQPERQAFETLLGQGVHDCFRVLNPESVAYSWWDYRMNAYKRNLGLRIDHILASSAAVSQCKTCYIDHIPRSWERPSDHAPVVAVFEW